MHRGEAMKPSKCTQGPGRRTSESNRAGPGHVTPGVHGEDCRR